MHRGIIPHEENITVLNLDLLLEMDYVFVSIDISPPKKNIFPFLIKHEIPFIDVGMGVNIADDRLFGTLRTTSSTLESPDSYIGRVSLEDVEDDVYTSNIQISELNALNAAMAVIK